MTDVCYIWASSSTTVVICGIFFIIWRCLRRLIKQTHSSSQHVCQTCSIERPNFNEFQVSCQRQDSTWNAGLPGTCSDARRVIQENSVLRPTLVPIDVLPTRSHCVVSTNESITTNSMTHDCEDSSHANILQENLSHSGGKEICIRPFNYCNDIYNVSERSMMKTVGGKLVVSVAHYVTSRGDCLMLDNMGISLWVPPNAVSVGEEELVCLVLNWDLSDNPSMSEAESLVSPVVYVGPHGLKLNKPCELHYRHCAYDPRHIVVMRSQTDLHGEKQWEEMCGQENQDGICKMSSDECILNINTFTLYTCIQRPLRHLKMAKWLQIAAFSNPLEKRIDHHEVRVYFLNKTPCALQWAIQNEAQFEHVLMCPEKAFLFHGQVEDILDIRVTLKYLSSEWESIDNDIYERVPYLHIWHGQCPHIVMCFKKKPKHSVRELNFHLNIYQETLENEGEKIVVHATEDTRCVYDNSCVINIHTSESQDKKPLPKVEVKKNEDIVNVSIDPNQGLPAVILDELHTECTQYIPYELRKHLKIKLDPLNALGNDWRRLADILNLSQFIEYLKSLNCSPTEVLLSVIEHRNITLEEFAIGQVVSEEKMLMHDERRVTQTILNEIQRFDAERIVNEYLYQQRTSASGSVRGGLQHDERVQTNPVNALDQEKIVIPNKTLNLNAEDEVTQVSLVSDNGHENYAYT